MDDLTQAIVAVPRRVRPRPPTPSGCAFDRHRPEGSGDDTTILVLRLGDVVAASAGATSERRSPAPRCPGPCVPVPGTGIRDRSKAQMRTAWKDMVVVVAPRRSSVRAGYGRGGRRERAPAVGHRLHERLPEATEQAQRAAQGAVDRVHDANVGDKLRDAAHRVAESDAVTKAKDLAAHR